MSNDDPEPVKPNIGGGGGGERKHRNRNNHSIQSQQERHGNLLPQLTPNLQDASNRKLAPGSRPPNIPQTPVKPTRPRPYKPTQLEEGKETDVTIDSNLPA